VITVGLPVFEHTVMLFTSMNISLLGYNGLRYDSIRNALTQSATQTQRSELGQAG